jgi:predicted CopG family antitoxin
MPATTITIDGPMLKELKGLREGDQTLSALVRELLGAEIQRRKMAQAALKYTAFLSENPEEGLDLDAWSSAPLDSDPTPPSKKRK